MFIIFQNKESYTLCDTVENIFRGFRNTSSPVELCLSSRILDTARHPEKDSRQTKNQESPPGLGELIVHAVTVGPRIRGQAFFASTLLISSECDVEKIVFREIRNKQKTRSFPLALAN